MGLTVAKRHRGGTMDRFVALDFETADYGPDSACAVGLVEVVGKRIVKRQKYLIRPPRRSFVFTYLHGIDWQQVSKKPTFRQLWPELEPMFAGVEFISAHNAPFDRGVLQACCEKAGVTPPSNRFLCSMRLARRFWKVYPTRLPDVCRFLGIPLHHHDALSDAEACAKIVIASLRERDANAESKSTSEKFLIFTKKGG